MAKFLNDGTWEKEIKEAPLERLYALHDFYVMVAAHERVKAVDAEILKRQKENG